MAEGRRGGTHAFAALDVLDHELDRLVCGVHSRLRALYREGERVDDYEALPTTLPCVMPMISYVTPERAWMA